MLCFGLISINAQDYYVEDFEGNQPSDWTFENLWEWGLSAQLGSQFFPLDGNGTFFAGVNDDAAGQGVDASGRLVSPEIDLTMVSGALALEFDSYFLNGDYQGADETAKVFVSEDGGMNWVEVADLPGAGTWTKGRALISDYAGKTIQLAFEYSDGGGWNYGFGVDNVRIYGLLDRDMELNALATDHPGGFVGMEVNVQLQVTNAGAEVIDEIEFEFNNGVGFTASDLNVGTFETTIVEVPLELIDEGTITLSAEALTLNGSIDDNTDNNTSGEVELLVVTPHPDRGVLIEEATGTWCTWCPRGHVFMENMVERYPDHFVGIAVHNSDPMENPAYDAGLTGWAGFTGFPSVLFERDNVRSLSLLALERDFLEQVQDVPPVTLEIGADYNDATRELVTAVGGNFTENLGAGYRVVGVLVENDVTGTGSGYAQVNAYSGGGFGPMGGYEDLPSPVPAGMMVYELVGRELLAGFEGDPNSLPASISAGEKHAYLFDTLVVNASYDTDNLVIVGMITNPSGEIENVFQLPLDQAIANGVSSLITSNREVFRNDLARVFPNPFAGETTLELTLEQASDVTLEVFNAAGQRVLFQELGMQPAGTFQKAINGRSWENGVYFIQVSMDGVKAVKQVTLSK